MYAISLDTQSTPEEILDFGEALSLTFPIAFSGVSMVPTFNVKQQATKVALDGDGVVVYRGDMGVGTPAEYEAVMAKLAAGN